MQLEVQTSVSVAFAELGASIGERCDEEAAMQSALIIEDHEQSRDWLVSLLRQTFDGIAVRTAANAAQARAALAEQDFSLVLFDLNLPDGRGVDLIREVAERSPDTYRVVATIFDDEEHLFAALQAGAHGYLLKEQPAEQLVDRLRGILRGEPPLSPAIARQILRHFRAPGAPDTPNAPDARVSAAPGLTQRETEVLSLVAKGFSRAEIARLLGISINTAAGYIKTIYRKLDISTRAEAALEATRLGLVDSTALRRHGGDDPAAR